MNSIRRVFYFMEMYIQEKALTHVGPDGVRRVGIDFRGLDEALWHQDTDKVIRAIETIETIGVVPRECMEVLYESAYMFGPSKLLWEKTRGDWKKYQGRWRQSKYRALIRFISACNKISDFGNTDRKRLAEGLLALIKMCLGNDPACMDILLKSHPRLHEVVNLHLRSIIRADLSLEFKSNYWLDDFVDLSFPKSIKEITDELDRCMTNAVEVEVLEKGRLGERGRENDLIVSFTTEQGYGRFYTQSWLPSSFNNKFLKPKHRDSLQSHSIVPGLFATLRSSWSQVRPWIKDNPEFGSGLINSPHRQRTTLLDLMDGPELSFTNRWVSESEYKEFLDWSQDDYERCYTVLYNTTGTGDYKCAVLMNIISQKIDLGNGHQLVKFVMESSPSKRLLSLAVYILKTKGFEDDLKELIERVVDTNDAEIVPTNLLIECGEYAQKWLDNQVGKSYPVKKGTPIDDVREYVKAMRVKAIKSENHKVKIKGIFKKRKEK